MKTRRALLLVVAGVVFAGGLWLQGAVPNVPTGEWLPGPSLAAPRLGAASVVLDDGRVLVIGGSQGGSPSAAVEVYDASGTMAAAAPLSTARSGHSAAKLADGRVLVIGGTSAVTTDQGTVEGPTTSVEAYDPLANVWYPVGSLGVARTGATATAVGESRVLVAGGASADGSALDSWELWDATSGAVVASGLLSASRTEHAAAVAGKTTVLVAGGRNAQGVLGTADLVDVETGSVASIALTSPRAGATATRLLDGTVLVLGGTDGVNDLSSAEIIDPIAGTSSALTAAMAEPRRGAQAALLHNNNTVLVTGGTHAGALVATAEQFVPWRNEFRATLPPAVSRRGAVLASLPKAATGVALLAGGVAADGTPAASSELYGFATIKTDRDDYAPGEMVTITGTGWQPGETVSLTFREVPFIDEHPSLTAIVGPDGTFRNIDFAPDDADLGLRFYLTATGAGSTAQMTFTDSKPSAVAVSAQNPATIAPGGSATYTVTVTFNGNNNSCTSPLSIGAGLPTGAAYSFTPSSVTSTGGIVTSTLKITTTGLTPPGASQFSVLAADGGGGCQGSMTGNGLLVVVEPTTTTLTTGPNPSAFGQSVTLTATVAQTVGSTTPTGGTVTFKDGATTLGTATLLAGTATLPISTLAISGNPHNLTALYAGVANTFDPSTSAVVTQTVNQASTTTTVASSANPSVLGQSVTFTATVSPVAPGGGTRTGTVTFKDGATTLGTGGVNAGGTATFSTSTLAVGGHSITAVYGGDTNFTGSTSSTLTQTVNQAATATTLARTAGATPSAFGQSVTFTASVAPVGPGAGTATGTVTFKDGATTLGTGTLNGSAQAALTTTTLSVGSHTVTAVYGADTNFATSTSGGVAQTVNQAATTTTITADTPDPSLTSDPVTVNYVVAVTAPGTGTPTGNITVSAGPDSCVGTVAAGSCQIMFTSAGSKSLTASYAGDASFTGSTSATAPHTVNQAPQITSANAVTFVAGTAGTFTVAATGFPAPTFAVTGSLPSGVTLNTTTGLLSGTPAAGTGGTYPLTITATNGIAPAPNQAFTLTVNQAPAITSAASATFILNAASSFTVTASGFPAPSLSQSGALPNGVTFNASTGVLSGTPTVTGLFPITFTAANGVGANTIQSFTLTVGQPPSFTSANNTAFTVNSPGTFSVTAIGFPAPTFSSTGSLPSGVTLSNGGVLSGTPALGTVGSYPITVTASNGIGSDAVQNFTLVVNKGTVSFAGLPVSQTITYGTASVAVSGRVNGPQMLPGTVTVTVDGVSTGALNVTGNPNNFGGTLSTAAIPSSATPYTITYTYSGDTNFNASSDTSTTLTVNKATPTVAVTFPVSPISYDGNNHAATVTVTGVSGPLTLPADGSTTITYLKSGSSSGTPVDAGSYTASATFTSTNPNYNNASSTATASLVINKATPTVAVTFPASPTTYDGNNHPATVTVTGVSGPLALPADGSTTITYLKSGSPSGSPVNAGSYTASATFTSTNPNYNNASSTTPASLVINKATPTVAVTFAASPITYDGATHAATVLVTGVSGPLTLPADGSTTITYLKTGSPSGTPEDAGSYTASATFTSTNPNYNNASSTTNASLVINKATPTVAVAFAASPIAYDGATHAATITVSGISGPLAVPSDGTTSITYLKAGSPSGTPTDAGTYTASASFTSANSNYTDASSPADAVLVINKATPIVTVSFASTPVTYDGSPHVASVSVAGVSGPLSVPADGTTVITYLNAGSPSGPPTDAGSYTASAAFTSVNSNYTNATSTTDAVLVINKASSATTVSFADGPMTGYTGDPHPATATVTGVGGLNQSLTVTYTPGPGAPINVGNYTAEANFAGDANHDPSSGSASLAITKVDPTVTATGNTCTYDGNPCVGTGSAVGVKGEPLTPVNVTYKDGATLLASAPVNAGTYQVAARYAGDANYNQTQSAPATITITKASSTTTVTFADGPVTSYTGDPHPATAVVMGAGGLNESVTVTYTPGPGAPVSAGSHTADASFPGDANHDPSNGSATLTITKVDPTVTATGNTCTYDGNPCAGSGSAVGVKGESLTPLTIAYKDGATLLASAPVNAGNYQVAARYAGDTNYNQKQSASATITIDKAAASVTPNAATKTYGQSDPSFTGTVSGFVTSDGVTAIYSRTPGELANGSYTISATLSPAGVLANYTITYNTAPFTITKAAASVTPNAAGKTYGSADPLLTGTLAGFVATDHVTGTYSRTAGEAVAGNPYTISATLSPAAVLDNYDITYDTAVFTIGKATASVTPLANTKVYGQSDPALTGTLAGFLGSDSVTATYSRTSGETVGGSPYAISATLSPAAVLGNYLVTYNTAPFTIAKAALAVTADEKNKLLNAANPPLSGQLTGVVAGDGITASYATTATTTSPIGSYPITATLNDPNGKLANYSVSNTAGTLKIGYAPLGAACGGVGGHQILQPIDATGTSVFKQKSTVPAKFRVCDANGAAAGGAGVVKDFRLVQTQSGTAVNDVNEVVDSTTPDTTFRWSASDQQWIFNINTKGLSSNVTYVYSIELNDGSKIPFQFGLK